MIANMDKISIVGLNQEKEKILNLLMMYGAVEVTETELEELTSVQDDGVDTTIRQLEENIGIAKKVLEYLGRLDTRKKPLFFQKRQIGLKNFNENLLLPTGVLGDIFKTNRYIESSNQLKSERNKIRADISLLEPWKSYSLPLDFTGTKSTQALLGTIPKESGTDFTAALQELGAAVTQIFENDKELGLSVIFHNSDETEITAYLRECGFSKAEIGREHNTVQQKIESLQKLAEEKEREILGLTKTLTDIAVTKDTFEIVYDYMNLKLQRCQEQKKLFGTQRCFLLTGWIVEEKADRVIRKLNEEFTVHIETRKPEKGEQYPILLKNNKLVRPFEIITKMYSLPIPGGLDPNPAMAPFFFLFFGIMLGDAGYGILLSLITAILLKKYKFEGAMDSMMRLMFLCGISTIFWGAMFGSWFGDLFAVLGKATGIEWFSNVKAWWFNPLEGSNVVKLLIFSFAMGGIHIAWGMALKAWILIKQGKWLDAVFDVGFWYCVLGGLVLMLLGINPIGTYLAAGGAVGLILTQGRSQKNIIMKFFSGIASLYDVTGYLSDILSYSRLLGLGLSTAVIAQVVNTMGSLAGFNLGGIIVFILVFLLGHTFNIAINTLGTYVHTSRLQYVEFFGKFYEGGGKEFTPLAIRTKYITLKEEETRS